MPRSLGPGLISGIGTRRARSHPDAASPGKEAAARTSEAKSSLRAEGILGNLRGRMV